MSMRDRRILSSMTQEARAKAQKLRAEGKDPITGRKEGVKAAPCPACEVKAAKPRPPENKGGAA